MAVLIALSVLAQRLVALDDESAADVMSGPLDVLLMFETRWCEAMSRARQYGRPEPAQGADFRGWPEPGAA